MIVFNLRNSAAVLFVSCGIVGVLTFLPPVAGQPPVPEKQDGNAKVSTGQQSPSDKDKLQGNWQIMSIALEDKVLKREDKLGEWKDTFGKEMFFKDDRHGQVGYSTSKFKLDDTRDPKQITVYAYDGKQTYRGIYTLDGDTLKMCMNGDGTSVCRPEEFVTRKGSTVMITTFKRVAEKK